MTVTTPVGVAYEAVIGIEVHVQLRTASKMFCGCSNDLAEAAPNSRTCPVCLGMPGALPVINREAVRHVLATGLAIGARIPGVTRWDRKNYFYPDLPKGYQISQYELPLASSGSMTVETSHGPVEVGITRAHLEEDTARLVHTRLEGRPVSLLDYDRSGAPLMEIVTEPVIRDAETARRYAEELRLMLLTIGASDAAMESGQLRVEANVSLRQPGSRGFGTRVEVKNMNSFRSVERAIDFEIARQAAALEAGEALVQETRGWDDDRGLTYHMRTKETSEDYRYFPDPDLPPLRIDPGWLKEIEGTLPELPWARRRRYREELGLSPYDAGVLVGDVAATALFEAALAADPELPPKRLANWVTGEYLRLAKEEAPAAPRGEAAGQQGARPEPTGTPVALASPGAPVAGVTPGTLVPGAAPGAGRVSGIELAALVRMVEEGRISGTNAKEVFARHAATGRPVADIVAEAGLRQISDESALQVAVDEVIAEQPAAVADVRAGADKAIGFLVGQVMKKTRGQANAAVVQELLRSALGKESPWSS